jgi:hypothetical protein
LLVAAGLACSPTGSPTPTAPATVGPAQFDIPGFEVELLPGWLQRVEMEPIPEVFEEHPTAVEFPGSATMEGTVAGGALAKAVGQSFPVRDGFPRPLGDLEAYAIKDEAGDWVATRLATPREGPGLPSAGALEAARVETAEPVFVTGPTVTYEDVVSDTGIAHYPPLEVKVRGQRGLYLHQEINEEQDPPPTGLPVCTLVWREGDFYWRLSGICDSSSKGQYDLFHMLEVVNNSLVEYDAASGRWLELR